MYRNCTHRGHIEQTQQGWVSTCENSGKISWDSFFCANVILLFFFNCLYFIFFLDPFALFGKIWDTHYNFLNASYLFCFYLFENKGANIFLAKFWLSKSEIKDFVKKGRHLQSFERLGLCCYKWKVRNFTITNSQCFHVRHIKVCDSNAIYLNLYDCLEKG